MSVHFIIVVFAVINNNVYIVIGSTSCLVNSSCPLWHSVDQASGQCECCDIQNIIGLVTCKQNQVEILWGHCMTWNNATQDVEVSSCLFIHQDRNLKDPCYNYNELSMRKHSFYTYSIPINISGSELNRFVCGGYNRKGAQCRECIDGYGPAVFSDSGTCADCSKHQYHWILYFIFQLTMVTIMYLVVILFEINGTASPLNIIITYSQLSTIATTINSEVYVGLVHYLSRKSVTCCLTLLGVWNLDFFRLILPPMCVSTSTKAITLLLFDYVIAFYPLLLTIFILVGIEVYDRYSQTISCSSTPLKMICCKANWNPKETILKTCATFLLLSYSKFLFVSIRLLLAVDSYIVNCRDESIPASTNLLYDPTIRFLGSEHIPYVILASSITVIFVLLPPLLLLLYPSRIFRACLKFMGFKRWDILHLVMDIFQGWFKDGTGNLVDYRPFSALYMLIRILFVSASAAIKLNIVITVTFFWPILGLFHVILGVLFLVVKPYKISRMNHTDGLILLLFGTMVLTCLLATNFTFILAIVIVILVIISVSLYCISKCVKKCCIW